MSLIYDLFLQQKSEDFTDLHNVCAKRVKYSSPKLFLLQRVPKDKKKHQTVNLNQTDGLNILDCKAAHSRKSKSVYQNGNEEEETTREQNWV